MFVKIKNIPSYLTKERFAKIIVYTSGTNHQDKTPGKKKKKSIYNNYAL